MSAKTEQTWRLALMPAILFVISIIVASSQAMAACDWRDVQCWENESGLSGYIDCSNWYNLTIPGWNLGCQSTQAAMGSTYAGLAAYMFARNGNNFGIDNNRNEYLRRFFGGLVDQVRVVYDANMLDEDWCVLVALLRSSRTYCIISQFLADPVSFNV